MINEGSVTPRTDEVEKEITSDRGYVMVNPLFRFARALERENTELRNALTALVKQFDAYKNGWLGEDKWRERVGLGDDLKRAHDAIAKSERKVNHGPT